MKANAEDKSAKNNVRKPKSELENRHGDPSFERYSSDVGFGGPETWYSHSDDTGGGLYAPVSQDHSGKGPKGYRRSDERIHEDICEALARDPDIDARDLEVIVREGEVTLTGSVEDKWMKRAAEDVTEGVHGVRDVQNWIALRRRE